MADIHVLPGVEQHALDLLPADRVLSSAMSADLVDVVVIGIGRNGEWKRWASHPDKPHIIGMLAESLVYFSTRQAIVDEPPETA